MMNCFPNQLNQFKYFPAVHNIFSCSTRSGFFFLFFIVCVFVFLKLDIEVSMYLYPIIVLISIS